MGIRSEIIRKLEESGAEEAVRRLVAASLSGPDALEAALAEKTVAPHPEEEEEEKSMQSAASVYLQSITVAGFRGIGPEATLTLEAHPGLTLVVGRNGSGKSSFFDALEVLLTGDSFRWKDKTAVWKRGWRNLHLSRGAAVSAKFQTEGVRGATNVERRWPDDARNVTDSPTTVQHVRQKRTDLAGVGWEAPLELFRPLLSHPELSGIALRPSGLYDTFNKVVGLEKTTSALALLAKARIKRQRRVKEASRHLKNEIRPRLESIDDDRSPRALESLSGWNWQCDQIEQLLIGDETPSAQSLQTLSALDPPTAEEVAAMAGEVREANSELESLRGSRMHRSSDLADLLESALRHQRQHGDATCPVCNEGALDTRWQADTQERIVELRDESRRYRQAEADLAGVVRQAGRLVKPPALPDDTPIDISALSETWRKWSSLPERPSEIPGHLIDGHSGLREAVGSVSEQAGERYSEREERWAPVRTALMDWLPKAREAMELRPVITTVKKAEATLVEIAEELRSARWEPIERQALGIWGELRLQSNIDLDSIALIGKGSQRRVELNANVDGREFQALGVASQGELNCLALSLFFPRGALPESPFRFLIIDDPVQAMDPARVDGLAKVFHEVATDRQLVVFTHDDRLPEALRRLDLPHRVLEVTRQKGSVVTVRSVLGPVEQYLEDAWVVASEDSLSKRFSHQVVPGFCRQALEAACVEKIRRDRIEQGVTHTRVEREIDRANTLMQKMALALLGDINQASRVRGEVARRWGRNLSEALGVCNRGSHAGYPGDLRGLINECRRLAGRIRGRF